MGNWKGRGRSGFLDPFGYSFLGPTPVKALAELDDAAQHVPGQLRVRSLTSTSARSNTRAMPGALPEGRTEGKGWVLTVPSAQ